MWVPLRRIKIPVAAKWYIFFLRLRTCRRRLPRRRRRRVFPRLPLSEVSVIKPQVEDRSIWFLWCVVPPFMNEEQVEAVCRLQPWHGPYLRWDSLNARGKLISIRGCLSITSPIEEFVNCFAKRVAFNCLEKTNRTQWCSGFLAINLECSF